MQGNEQSNSSNEFVWYEVSGLLGQSHRREITLEQLFIVKNNWDDAITFPVSSPRRADALSTSSHLFKANQSRSRKQNRIRFTESPWEFHNRMGPSPSVWNRSTSAEIESRRRRNTRSRTVWRRTTFDWHSLALNRESSVPVARLRELWGENSNRRDSRGEQKLTSVHRHIRRVRFDPSLFVAPDDHWYSDRHPFAGINVI